MSGNNKVSWNMTFKTFTSCLALVVTGAIIGAAFAGSRDQLSAQTGNSSIYRHLDLFGDVLERVRNDYVEKPDDKKLIESAINGMLTSLDPHSAYLSAESLNDMQVQTRGEFGGLGIEVRMENNLVKVISPIDGTPAAEAGILPGDYISALDGEQVEGMTLKEAVDLMRGPVGSEIVITILRKNAKEPFDVNLKRAVIQINKVSHRIESKDIGYVRLPSFNERTSTGLEDAIKAIQKEVKEDNIKGYILDLRNNPGGLLEQAIKVSDAFLNQGAIVTTRGRNLEETQRANAHEGDITNGKKVIVLINGGSASASEIVAGALLDLKRATLIGSRSFGKGSVQTIIPLGQKSAIRLTTALYYTPSNTSIQAKGIVPNIIVDQELPEEFIGKPIKTKGEASLKGHIKVNAKKEEEHGSLSYVPADATKDTQLQYAIKLIHGEIQPPKEPGQKGVLNEETKNSAITTPTDQPEVKSVETPASNDDQKAKDDQTETDQTDPNVNVDEPAETKTPEAAEPEAAPEKPADPKTDAEPSVKVDEPAAQEDKPAETPKTDPDQSETDQTDPSVNVDEPAKPQ